MALVIVERRFDAPEDSAELQARQDAVSWCLTTHRVRLLRTYFSLDRRHMVCLYEAPDVESVRLTQRTAGLAVEHAWSANPLADVRAEAPAGYSLVVVQRALPQGVTLEQVQYKLTDPTGCGKRLRLSQVGAFLSLDCSRMCCVYYSPDLESVRTVSRELEVPIERLWNAQLIESAG